MLKNKVIISLVSTLVFIFPLIYQPFHDVMHHGDYVEHHDGFSSSQEKCLVYEYNFAHFDIPSPILFDGINRLNNSTAYFFYYFSIVSLEVNSTSSRAPPVV